jgi:hypothetical protein
MSMIRCDKCEDLIDSDIDPDCFGEFGKGEETLCENCRQNAAEAAYERFCSDFHDGGNVSFKSLQQQQIEARRLK